MASVRWRADIVLGLLLAAAAMLPPPASGQGAPAPPPRGNAAQGALKIVIIEGEDAVNVIRQNTAVAPVIEVRDRNDQPVAGALVRFAVTRGRASFNGARALTVTTNQAGRAVATGFTPSGTGALQVSATATFQGQTAAVTIAQTNVLTAATGGTTAGTTAGAATGTTSGTAAGTTAGAAAGTTAGASAGGTAAGASGAAAGAAGGGLSATTVGIVAGAAAGGALAAKKALGSSSPGGTPYAGPYSGPILFSVTNTSTGKVVCTFTINVVGTLTMHLTTASGGGVSGTADIVENNTLGQSTCTGASAGGPTLNNLAVNGSTTSLAFQSTQTFSTGATLTVMFQGALNGTEVAGTLNEAWSQSNGTVSVTAGSAVFPVILKQQ